MKPEPRKRNLKQYETGLVALFLALLIGATLAYASTIDVTVTIPAEKPDLTLSPADLYFEPRYPLDGDDVTITASIRNIGEVSVINIPVSFYVDDTLFATKNATVPSEATTNVSALWTATDVGAHEVTVRVDEQDLIEEHDEANNYARKTIKVTKPLALAIAATPEIIEANGTYISTVTAFVTNETGIGLAGVEVTFTTTLGTVSPDHVLTETSGIANTTLTASTSAGTEVVTGTAKINETHVEDTATVVFEITAEAETNNIITNTTITIEETNISIPYADVTIEDGVITINTTLENATIIAEYATAGTVISIAIEGGALEITLAEDVTVINNSVIGTISKIKLNTPSDEYITSTPEVGTASVDLDVEFQGTFTPKNLALETTLRERYEDLPLPDPGKLKDTLATYFGVDTTVIENNTPILVYAELSATNLTAADVTGVPLSITVNKAWFYTVAEGGPSKVSLFKLNETTGAVESTITMTSESYTINNSTVTFHATFDHFSVYAIVAQPSAAGPSGPDGGSGAHGGANPPGEITIPIANPGTNIFNFEWLGLDILSISMDLKQTGSMLKTALKEVEMPPKIPEPSGTLYACFEISSNVPPDNLKMVEVKFRVNEGWVRENSISVDEIKLVRYVGGVGWEALPTEKIGEDDRHIYFSAETPSLSLFAITGDKKAFEPQSSVQPSASMPPAPEASPPPLVSPARIPILEWFVIIVAIVASAIIVLLVYLVRKRRKS